MPFPPELIVCPICWAALPADNTGPRARAHITWHRRTETLGDWSEEGALAEVDYLLRARHRAPAADDAPTTRMAPITETVLRRPPVPAVRDLQGAALLRALADELDAEGLGDEDL